MPQSKDLFCRSKDDVKSAIAITRGGIFDKMLAYARAEFMQRNPSVEQSAGANNFISILLDLPEEETAEPTWIESGISHDLSVPSREKKPATK